MISDADFNVKLEKNISNISWQLYLGHTLKEEAALGTRLMWDYKNITIGSAYLLLNYQDEEPQLINYEMDLQYTWPGILNVKTQIGNIDDGINSTDDVNLFCMMQKDLPFHVPFVKEIIPYAGLATRAELEEHSIVLGINLKPIQDAYIKVEHVLDSHDEIDPKTDIQVGYTF